ncbi:lipolytic protein G-D-S-L family [Solidesulfovibrio carbinoliphilus subsp. oakridgensis]|uniref:Lipolytic protein G-D-S-L family n=1 Tax=Solidesulfovibrio carbinoliphilus subsp. oakridgensis TaxID=694327 RepID=G7QB34_9BACT|nr:GDSL-type esterase/lipase family protein [Solidesulfovibrio carbinoliphilus]EHJ48776.1 lipolytic protein G-D-S-L family [Solidesulfovibrio carbinoliphilus subsp. oakridgensis]
MKYHKSILALLCSSLICLSLLALYYKKGWDLAGGQLREISDNIDMLKTVMQDLGGVYARTRMSIILTQLQSQDEDLLVVFGDSIVEQMYYPATAGRNIINTGISGTKALEARPFLERILAASRGPLVVLSIGTNDALEKSLATADQFAAGYEELARLVLASGRKLVLATLPPLEDGKAASAMFDRASLASYNARIREIGRRTGAVVADVNDVLTRRQAAHPGPFTVDGVHLDAAAATVWRDTVYTAIRQALADGGA